MGDVTENERPQDAQRAADKGVQSVQRALDLLEIVAAAGGELKLSEIAAASGLNISTCHHLLATLVDKGFMARLPGKRTYVIGSRIVWLASQCLKQVNLPMRAQRVLDILSAKTEEAVQLAVLQGDDLVVVMRRDARKVVRVDTSSLGREGPVHATATGKAILAWLPEVEIKRILKARGLPRLTPRTITDMSVLMEELRLVRRHGFATDNEEYQPGVFCVGAAIRDYAGSVVGALSVSLPVFRLTESVCEKIKADVMSAAKTISSELGDPTGGIDQKCTTRATTH